jgi:hypothetical protein
MQRDAWEGRHRRPSQLALVFVATLAGAGCGHGPRAAASPTPSCVRAEIGGRSVCLVAGHRCNPRYEQQYERHHFRCKRNAAGEYRLWQPVKSGTPKP